MFSREGIDFFFRYTKSSYTCSPSKISKEMKIKMVNMNNK